MKTFVKFPPLGGNHGVFAVNCEVVCQFYILPYCSNYSQIVVEHSALYRVLS